LGEGATSKLVYLFDRRSGSYYGSGGPYMKFKKIK